LRITDVQAYATSFPIAPAKRVALGIGTAVKRDAVLVRVATDEGISGWGEAHHGRAHTAVARLIETTLKQLVMGLDPGEIVAIWDRMYRFQLASHGMGAGACLAMSGIDMALWDIRAKALGLPLYKLLGGSARPVPAYAGGVSLGFQDPSALIDEARPHVEAGYKAVKLRVGDTPARDLARVAAVRRAFGDEQPKYLNSPETPLYTKGNLLYAADVARESIRTQAYPRGHHHSGLTVSQFIWGLAFSSRSAGGIQSLSFW